MFYEDGDLKVSRNPLGYGIYKYVIEEEFEGKVYSHEFLAHNIGSTTLQLYINSFRKEVAKCLVRNVLNRNVQ